MKKLGKKQTQAYIPENLEYLAKNLAQIRISRMNGGTFSVSCEGLKEAINHLQRKDKEKIEKFYGLNGGINHSKKLGVSTSKDIAFKRMFDEVITVIRRLLRLDYMYMYDADLKKIVSNLLKKINKKDVDISDVEIIKYLLFFLVIFQNGPKMVFEEDDMDVDTEANSEYTFDEYAILQNAYNELKDLPDESLNIKLVCHLIDMFDLIDVLSIKKGFGITIPKSQLPEDMDISEIKEIRTLGQVRKIKERIFQYGSWEFTNEIILGNFEVISNLGEFAEELDQIRKDWSKITEFKVGQKQLRTSDGIRTLDIYNIGGFEFTDIYEVMFLYLERNIIGT